MAAIDTLISNMGTFILNPLIGLMFTVALAVFFWGIFEFIWQADNPTARTTGQSHMFWGVIGMVIMSSVYALINVLKASFGI